MQKHHLRLSALLRTCTIGLATIALPLVSACGQESSEGSLDANAFNIGSFLSAGQNSDGTLDEDGVLKRNSDGEICATVACAPGFTAADLDGDGCEESCVENTIYCHTDGECPDGSYCSFGNDIEDPKPMPAPEEGDADPNGSDETKANGSDANGGDANGGQTEPAMPGTCEKLPDECVEVTVCTACLPPDEHKPSEADETNADKSAPDHRVDADDPACGQCWTEIICKEPEPDPTCPDGQRLEYVTVCADQPGEPTEPGDDTETKPEDANVPGDGPDANNADALCWDEPVCVDDHQLSCENVLCAEGYSCIEGIAGPICVEDNNQCGDGSELICDMTPPDCLDSEEVAIIEGCYECVPAGICSGSGGGSGEVDPDNGAGPDQPGDADSNG